MTSTPAAAVPPALQRSFDAWAAAGRPADEPTRWSFDHWTAHVPDLPACLECKPLTRAGSLELMNKHPGVSLPALEQVMQDDPVMARLGKARKSG